MIDTNKARELAQRLQHGRLVATNGPHVTSDELAALLLQLAEAHDRMAKDAARYRWLRNNHSKRIWNHVLDDDLKDRTPTVEAAIDAAMGAERND